LKKGTFLAFLEEVQEEGGEVEQSRKELPISVETQTQAWGEELRDCS